MDYLLNWGTNSESDKQKPANKDGKKSQEKKHLSKKLQFDTDDIDTVDNTILEEFNKQTNESGI